MTDFAKHLSAFQLMEYLPLHRASTNGKAKHFHHLTTLVYLSYPSCCVCADIRFLLSEPPPPPREKKNGAKIVLRSEWCTFIITHCAARDARGWLHAHVQQMMSALPLIEGIRSDDGCIEESFLKCHAVACYTKGMHLCRARISRFLNSCIKRSRRMLAHI